AYGALPPARPRSRPRHPEPGPPRPVRSRGQSAQAWLARRGQNVLPWARFLFGASLSTLAESPSLFQAASLPLAWALSQAYPTKMRVLLWAMAIPAFAAHY